MTEVSNDRINPKYYQWLRDICGIDVIDITRHMNFNLGNVIKYVLRSGKKDEAGMSNKAKEVEDLKKAQWYLNDEIKRLEPEVNTTKPLPIFYIDNPNNFQTVLTNLYTAATVGDKDKIKKFYKDLEDFDVYYLDKSEHKRMWEFIGEQRKGNIGTIGGGFKVIFEPTSLGTLVDVQCGDKTLSIRDSSDWQN